MDAPATVHEPVLLAETLAALAVRPGGRYVDATVGGGGHAAAILERAAPDGTLVGVDRDPAALARAGAALARFGDRATLVHGDFGDLAGILGGLGVGPVDGLLCDLGMSSDQLADPARGFSFAAAGPLDMRMDPTRGEPLALWLRRRSSDELERVLRDYGEEPRARRIARALREAHDRGELRTTLDLAGVVARAAPSHGRLHPATRTFQALRIAVNDELGALARLLDGFVDLLAPGGRIAVIAFHSLEDRMVKRRLRDLSAPGDPAAPLTLPFRKPRIASPDEVARNPRARSAKLRVAERRAA